MFSRHGLALRHVALKRLRLGAPKATLATFACRRAHASTAAQQDADQHSRDVPLDSSSPPAVEGLLAKQARLEKTITRSTAISRGKKASAAARAAGLEPPTKPKAKGRKSSEATAKLLVQGSKDHHDLSTFLSFAQKHNLSTTSTVYKGTHYEYTVASSLKTFGFDLHRTGKSNDLGIDLLGTWRLPGQKQDLKVLVQCKASKPMPAMARELEGAYAGAPAEWQGEGTIALLVSTKPATKGVVTAVQRSRSPIGVMQVDREGMPRQFLWNAVAGDRGLAGLGVTVKYSGGEKAASRTCNVSSGAEGSKESEASIALTWMGRPMHAVTSPEESGRLV